MSLVQSLFCGKKANSDPTNWKKIIINPHSEVLCLCMCVYIYRFIYIKIIYINIYFIITCIICVFPKDDFFLTNLQAFFPKVEIWKL